jgi:hypothetical protein
LENVNHELKGVNLEKIKEWTKEYDVEEYECLIFAMLSKYKKVHDKCELTAKHCEVEVVTDNFIGFVDVILEDGEGNWWIADIKTAASYSPMLNSTLPFHPQLSLYASNYEVIAKNLGLDPDKYQGIRYRVTTKSRLIRKKEESNGEFIGRLLCSVKSLDIPIPKEAMDPEVISQVHQKIYNKIKSSKKENDYQPNYSQCLQFYKPCEYFSNCHGKTFSEVKTAMAVISSD